MKTAILNALTEEITLIEDWLEYAPDEDMTMFGTLEEAQIQIDGMKADLEGNEEIFPEALNDPEIMLLCWNYVIDQRETRKCGTEEIRHNDKKGRNLQ